MRKFICSVCGYTYDETAGIPKDGIAPGTAWEDLPADWVCPLCGATKDEFKDLQKVSLTGTQNPSYQKNDDVYEVKDFSPAILSVLFSNLSKGSEKQYRTEEATLFNKLALYYQGVENAEDKNQFSDLNYLIQQDLNAGFTQAKALAVANSDRGALRALTWGEKVTTMLNSFMRRLDKDQFLENTNIYVCEICGFTYSGDEPPEICPVCKVPKLKITKIDRR